MLEVEVANECIVVVSHAGYQVQARWYDDRTRACDEVGLHDRRSQRADTSGCGADAVCRIRIWQIGSAVHDIRVGRQRGAGERHKNESYG